MLFLPVFSGFLAENKLEHVIEDQREKEYAKSLYEELYADSIVFAKIQRILREKALETPRNSVTIFYEKCVRGGVLPWWQFYTKYK